MKYIDLKTILKVIHFAKLAGASLPTIHLAIHLLKHFDGSLATSDSQRGFALAGKAGFVYIIRRQENGERFKIGYRSKAPWRDSQLRSQMADNEDFFLVIPTKDAKDLEKKLRNTFNRHGKKSEWFSLSDLERLEIALIAAIAQLAAGDDLGMAAVDSKTIQLATTLFYQLLELAKRQQEKAAPKAPKKKKKAPAPAAAKVKPNLDDLAALPEMDWSWKNVLRKNYRALPKAKGKAGYVTIIRDNAAKRGKIYFDDHPVASIETALLEQFSHFDLEVVLVLEVDDKKKAKKALRAPAENKDGNGWTELSNEEIGAVREIAQHGNVMKSVYVSPKTHWRLKSLPSENYREYPVLEKPAGYVCLVQGVRPGKLRKFWYALRPKDLAGDFKLKLMLNTPYDAIHAPKPVRFKCIIEAEHAASFEKFLHKRYAAHETRGFFNLSDDQLKEIYALGN